MALRVEAVTRDPSAMLVSARGLVFTAKADAMGEIEKRDGSGEGNAQDLADALSSDDQFKRLVGGKVRRTREQAALCVAVRKIAFDRCGGWPGFLENARKSTGRPRSPRRKSTASG
ncbi:hypothetical protein ACFQ1L_21365 [Phytohabitans flavus]|uniref:hypothetical protein n=1 Tax=Phytohabitans flavus TaxID=1076124 RepID=UPI0036328D24